MDDLSAHSLEPADEPRPVYLSNCDPDDETDAFEDDGQAQLAA